MASASQILEFIQLLGGLAVAEANRRIASGVGFVLPSVCIAQSAIETGWGTAGIMIKANAFFGIKAGGSWTGKVYRADTWEVADGTAYNTSANFRAYDSLAESVADYYNLIGNASRYANALSYDTDKSAWKTPRECITAIWSGGYATDTLYVEKIMSTINARDLVKYDALVTGEGTPALDSQSYIFTYDDLIQGIITAVDSGRTLGNKTDINTCIAVNWSRAKTVKSNATLTIFGVPEGAKLIFCSITGETLQYSLIYNNGDTVELKEGQIIGFYLDFNGVETRVNDLDKNIAIGFSGGLPVSVEISKSVLAHFVKIK